MQICKIPGENLVNFNGPTNYIDGVDLGPVYMEVGDPR